MIVVKPEVNTPAAAADVAQVAAKAPRVRTLAASIAAFVSEAGVRKAEAGRIAALFAACEAHGCEAVIERLTTDRKSCDARAPEKLAPDATPEQVDAASRERSMYHTLSKGITLASAYAADAVAMTRANAERGFAETITFAREILQAKRDKAREADLAALLLQEARPNGNADLKARAAADAKAAAVIRADVAKREAEKAARKVATPGSVVAAFLKAVNALPTPEDREAAIKLARSASFKAGTWQV